MADDNTDTPASADPLSVAGQPAGERLMQQVANQHHPAGVASPSREQVAIVLHALADYTALQAALRHRPEPGRSDPALSAARWLHDVGHQLEDGCFQMLDGLEVAVEALPNKAA